MVIKTLGIFFLICLLNSCTTGFIYTDITRPLCVDMRNTDTGSRRAIGSTKKLEIPTTRVDVSAEWSTRAIGDIAKKNNLHTVYYCDRRTLSILGGLFRKQEVIIYGE